MQSCSFCKSPVGPRRQMLSSSEAAICLSCSEHAVQVLGAPRRVRTTGMLIPREIKRELERYVIGQDEAKEVLSVSAYTHYKRIERMETDHDIEITKSNVLLWGPSGSGKTYLIQTLAKLLDVPFVQADATTLTKSGYVGDDVDSVLQTLLEKAGDDPEKASRGIVYIDEVDKIVSTGDKKDPGGRSVQEAFLKMMEGHEVNVSVGTSLQPRSIPVDTSNILFIFGGAFVDLPEASDQKPDKVLGFNTPTPKQQDATVGHEAFIRYGLIPEFMGRIPVIARLNPLKKEDLRAIMTEPKNAVVRQYQALFEMDGIRLSFEDPALDYIAEQAIQKKTGARGLKGLIEKKMLRLMYELPGSDTESVVITVDMLKGEGRPVLAAPPQLSLH